MFEKLSTTRNAENTDLEPTDRIERVQNILTSVDNTVLKNIFLHILQKSKQPLSIENYIPTNEVEVTHSEETGLKGVMRRDYSNNTLGIELNAADYETLDERLYSYFVENNLLQSLTTAKSELREHLRSIEVTLTLCHEEVHALSSNDCQIDGDRLSTHDGFQSKFYNLDAQGELELTKVIGVNINEGFTELIANKVFEEYLSQTGSLPAEIKRLYLEAPDYIKNGPFYQHIDVAKNYMAFVSALTNLPQETIENSLIKAYFERSAIVPQEILDELKEIGADAVEIFLFKESVENSDLPGVNKLDIEAMVKKLPKEQQINMNRLVLDWLNRQTKQVDEFQAAA